MALVVIIDNPPVAAMVKLASFTIAGTVTGGDGNPAARQVVVIDPVGRDAGPRVASHGVSSASTGAFSLTVTGVHPSQPLEVIGVSQSDELSAIIGRA